MGCRTSGYGFGADFGGILSFRIARAGDQWSVEFFIDSHAQTASWRLFPTEAEARAYGELQLQGRA